MANNYLQFSVAVEINPDKMIQLKELDQWQNEIFNNDVDFDVELIIKTAPEFIQPILQNTDYVRDLLIYAGFSTTLEQDKYYVYCEDCGNVDAAVTWIYTLLQADLLQPKRGYVVFTWAETCDKPRVDEFGGGCAMISKIGIEFQQNPYNWATDAYDQLRRDLAYQHNHQEIV